jgi:hypothetical protein
MQGIARARRGEPANGVLEVRVRTPPFLGPLAFLAVLLTVVLRKEGPFNPVRIAFQTPPLEGVIADHPYKVIVVLTDATGSELQRIEKAFESDLDQSVLPERPLAIGPGYQENIDESETAYPQSLGEPAPAPAP